MMSTKKLTETTDQDKHHENIDMVKQLTEVLESTDQIKANAEKKKKWDLIVSQIKDYLNNN